MKDSLAQHIIRLTEGKLDPDTISKMLLDDSVLLAESERIMKMHAKEGGKKGQEATAIAAMYPQLRALTDPNERDTYKQEISAAVKKYSDRWSGVTQQRRTQVVPQSRVDYSHTQGT